jgi:hypothetical protein
MIEKVVFQGTLKMLEKDVENFIELLKCNALEAEFESAKAKNYTITIEED